MLADLDLVRDVKHGDKNAFAELVRRHQRAVYRLAMRFTRDHGAAEDVVQDSFVKAFQKIAMFEERSSFKSWLFRIAINTAKNRLRGGAGRTEVDVEDVVLSVESHVEEDFQFKEVHETITDEVQKLPERQRMALTLRVFEEMSFQEIAQIMNCPYDTAKANYRHAVLKLKKILVQRGIADEEKSEESSVSSEPIEE